MPRSAGARPDFASRLAALAFDGALCDAAEVVCEGGAGAGDAPRLPVARVLLAAASPALEVKLREAGSSAGRGVAGGGQHAKHLGAGDAAELRLPVTAEALRQAIAFCCGEDFDAIRGRCPLEDLRAAAEALHLVELRALCRRALRSAGEAPRQRELGGSRWLLAASLVLGFVTLGAWSPACTYLLDNDGYFMDDRMIAKNPVVYESVFDWARLLRTDYWGLDMFDGSWTHKSFRPLAVLTFRWNYLLHGFVSSGWHITNLALHLAATALLWAFASRSLRLPAAWGALLAALFLAHPVHTESVLYIVGRADLLCLALVLLAAIVFEPCLSASGGLRACLSASLRLPMAVALIVAAGLCKETGFCFFGLLAGWEILAAISGDDRQGRRTSGRCASLVRLLALLLLGAGACAWRWRYTAGTVIERMDPHSNPVAPEPDPAVRAMSYVLLHGVYWKLLVWPTFLCYDYSYDAIPLVRTPGDLRLLLPLCAYLFLAALLCLSMGALRPGGGLGRISPRARQAPIIGLAILALSFLPMSNIFFPVGTLIGERLLYIPSAGLLLTVVGLASLAEAAPAPGLPRRWPSAALLACGLAGAWLCARRVPDWSSPEAITVADGLKQHRSTRVQYNYANWHLSMKNYDEALKLYLHTISIDPTDRDSMPLHHAGQILLYQGRYDEAQRYLAKAVAGYFSPLVMAEEEVWHDYALSLWFANDVHGAIENFKNALIINPEFTKALNNMGCAEGLGALTGKFGVDALHRSVEALNMALQLDPSSVLYWRNFAGMLRMGGNAQGAAEAWQRLRAMNPQAAEEAAPPEDCAWEFGFR